ncbi:unnamed protein product [Gongylonema pulchrum]|uniref:Uncharacterized protein n=1 Tax=Gongylonema pulchrum TaxID=637853 RepID=A0A183DJD3_9BILA|nr:unnamed protein product [Gongylonema pulchrum]
MDNSTEKRLTRLAITVPSAECLIGPMTCHFSKFDGWTGSRTRKVSLSFATIADPSATAAPPQTERVLILLAAYRTHHIVKNWKCRTDQERV